LLDIPALRGISRFVATVSCKSAIIAAGAVSSSAPAGEEVKSMHTVTKKELVDRIADQNNEKRVVVKKIVQAFLDEAIGELGKGNRLEFRDFGIFTVKERAPRVGQNPRTMEKVEVPANTTVKFKVGRMMKRKLPNV
jgi:integration host factor subunit beta